MSAATSNISATPTADGCFVEICDGTTNRLVPAQDAYDLHQALAAILPELVQPFEPFPRPPHP